MLHVRARHAADLKETTHTPCAQADTAHAGVGACLASHAAAGEATADVRGAGGAGAAEAGLCTESAAFSFLGNLPDSLS